MKYYFLSTFFLLGLSFGTLKAEDTTKKVESLKMEVKGLKTQQERLHKELNALSLKNAKTEVQMSELQTVNKKLISSIDSLRNEHSIVVANQKADKSELVDRIGKTNAMVEATKNVLSSRTLWGLCGLFILLAAIIVTTIAFVKKLKAGTTSIDDVRKAQDALQTAQSKMQEESIKLDDKLLELFDKQMSNSHKFVSNDKPDHSLALKVADEVAKIELNMSRMDSSIRGYKQLAKAVSRIKDNFNANGYEIVDMLGKPYNEGMKVIAEFVLDEDLEEGQQIITGITKPQVNYNGQMIQAARITVSQNI